MTGHENQFLNRPRNSYIPLANKPLIVTTRDITGTGAANKQQMFFLFKPNTMRERATVDLLYPTPNWLRNEIYGKLAKTTFTRITDIGDTRIIDTGLIRITS